MNNLIKSKPIIWFDIDDVILYLWEQLTYHYNLEYWTNKTLKDSWNMEYEKVYFVVEKYNLYKNMLATSILPVLKEKRKDIYLLLCTSRENKYVDDTMSELDRHWLDYDDIFMWEKKSEVCKSEKIQYFFDDALHNIVDINTNYPETKTYLVERDRNLWDIDIKWLTEKEICKILKKL